MMKATVMLDKVSNVTNYVPWIRLNVNNAAELKAANIEKSNAKKITKTKRKKLYISNQGSEKMQMNFSSNVISLNHNESVTKVLSRTQRSPPRFKNVLRLLQLSERHISSVSSNDSDNSTPDYSGHESNVQLVFEAVKSTYGGAVDTFQHKHSYASSISELHNHSSSAKNKSSTDNKQNSVSMDSSSLESFNSEGEFTLDDVSSAMEPDVSEGLKPDDYVHPTVGMQIFDVDFGFDETVFPTEVTNVVFSTDNVDLSIVSGFNEDKSSDSFHSGHDQISNSGSRLASESNLLSDDSYLSSFDFGKDDLNLNIESSGSGDTSVKFSNKSSELGSAGDVDDSVVNGINLNETNNNEVNSTTKEEKSYEEDGIESSVESGGEIVNAVTESCGEDLFSCKNGRCIYVGFRCDGIDDCGDNSDENECASAEVTEAPAFVECGVDLFTCNNSRCVYVGFKCDGIDDCGDNSDELHCDTEDDKEKSAEEESSEDTWLVLFKKKIMSNVEKGKIHEDQTNHKSNVSVTVSKQTPEKSKINKGDPAAANKSKSSLQTQPETNSTKSYSRKLNKSKINTTEANKNPVDNNIEKKPPTEENIKGEQLYIKSKQNQMNFKGSEQKKVFVVPGSNSRSNKKFPPKINPGKLLNENTENANNVVQGDEPQPLNQKSPFSASSTISIADKEDTIYFVREDVFDKLCSERNKCLSSTFQKGYFLTSLEMEQLRAPECKVSGTKCSVDNSSNKRNEYIVDNKLCQCKCSTSSSFQVTTNAKYDIINTIGYSSKGDALNDIISDRYSVASGDTYLESGDAQEEKIKEDPFSEMLSDEPIRTCGDDLITCNNSRCVYVGFTCDGIDDCGDNSDEQHCDY